MGNFKKVEVHFDRKKSYRKIFHLKYSVKKEFLKTFILSIDFFAAG